MVGIHACWKMENLPKARPNLPINSHSVIFYGAFLEMEAMPSRSVRTARSLLR
jgi:hypothetical protein